MSFYPRLFEKFSEHSDPVKDMDIGSSKNLFIEKVIDRFDTHKMPLYRWVSSWILKDSTSLEIEGDTIIIKFGEYNHYDYKDFSKEFSTHLKWHYHELGIAYMRKFKNKLTIKFKEPLYESINEKFSEHSDPIRDMGIGYDFELIDIIEPSGPWDVSSIGEHAVKNILRNFDLYRHTYNDLLFIKKTGSPLYVNQMIGKRILYKGKIYKIPNES